LQKTEEKSRLKGGELTFTGKEVHKPKILEKGKAGPKVLKKAKGKKVDFWQERRPFTSF